MRVMMMMMMCNADGFWIKLSGGLLEYRHLAGYTGTREMLEYPDKPGVSVWMRRRQPWKRLFLGSTQHIHPR